MHDAMDGNRGRVWFVGGAIAVAVLVVVAAWLGPSGCQASNGSGSGLAYELPLRPRSPLDDVIDRRTANDGTAAQAPATPEPPAPRPLPPSSEPEVRIRIAALRGAPAELSASGGLEVREADAEGNALRVASPIVISSDGRGWIVRESGGSGREWRFEHTRPLEVTAVNESRPIAFAGKSWPGMMRLHAVGEPPAGIDVVVFVGLERYLPGVLAKELYRNWKLETYRAQAIAARSYAVAEAAYWKDRRHFDMVAGEASQAWIGETDNTNAKRGVADTRGVLLVYEDRVVPAYYSSCCGGAAADAIDAVTRNPNHDIAPLALGSDARGSRRACCRQAPTASWTEKVPVDEVARRLSAWGRENGRADLASIRGLASIRVTAVNSAGRARTIQVVDGGGTRIDLDAEVLRAAINGFPSDPARPTSADAAPRRTLKSSNVEVAIEGSTVVFRGRGHGHGVGLCQYGAESMARSGRDWRGILALYYPGAQPERCW